VSLRSLVDFGVGKDGVHMNKTSLAVLCTALAITLACIAASSAVILAEDGNALLTVDHYVKVRSAVPAINGQITQIYVRERAEIGTALRSPNLSDRVVLFVHGAGTPAEVAFDVDYQDYSWMAYLARAGFDVFATDMTGYGRSTRPAFMNDPCNLSTEQQATFVPVFLSASCKAEYTKQLTTIDSDHNDIDAVVNYIRALRHVERVSLVAWSLGGPRAGGYAAAHPEKIGKLVLLAPAYNRMVSTNPPAAVPANGAAFNTQSHTEFTANWDRQVGCPNQYDPATSDSVWTSMLQSDPVGATWGPGVRRAPNTTNWGWSTEVVAKMKTPTLMVTGVHDKQVGPDRVRELYADLGAKEKVFIDLGCSSHNAMWERNHLILFKASLEWLTQSSVNGMKEGMLKLGY
jgi:pimeloyl-ACP methyl ester carboxylesterase